MRESRTGPAVNCTALVADELADIIEYTNGLPAMMVGSGAQIVRAVFWKPRSFRLVCRYDGSLEAHFTTEIRHAVI